MNELDPPQARYEHRSVPVVVDYFCGGGGFTCGALNAKAIVACGIDCDERARSTYIANNRNPNGEAVPFIAARIEELDVDVVSKHLANYIGWPLIFVGCPPCQPFTNLRTTKEPAAASREALRSFMDHVQALRPDFAVVENVPGIRAVKYGQLWSDSIERLQALGYLTRFGVVNAARFGVPQKRLRTILVACKSRYDEVPWPEETHCPETYRTVRDAFGEAKLCELEAGQTCNADPLHSAAALSELNLKRIRAIKQPGGSRTDWPDDLRLKCYLEHDGHTDVYGRMHWDRPAPTLTTRFVSLSNGRFGHPEEHRAITLREGALLQTFPPTYKFEDKSRDMNAAYIGNAVPPRLACVFIQAIKKRLVPISVGL